MLRCCFVMTGLVLAAPLSAGAYEVVEVTDGGSVAGKVTFNEAVPKRPPRKVTKDQNACGKSVPDETYVVASDKGFANVVVFIDGIRRGKKPDELAVEIDQKGCRFRPHVTAFPAGTKLWLKNSDVTLHNTHSYIGDKTAFNVALPMAGMKIKKRIKEAGVVKHTCDAGHTWMEGWSYVTEHPYVVVTDAKGRYEIKDVPAGTYTVKTWHEAEGTRSGEVTISAAGKATLDLSY